MNSLKNSQRVPLLWIFLISLITYTMSTFGAQEILILGEEISKKHSSSFMDVILVSESDRSKTLGDFLTHQKGITVRSQSSRGSLSTINIRGIGAGKAEHVLVLLDGVRLNTAQGSGVDVSRIPLAMVQKIEILRGGESALYGSDALGGVINIVTASVDSKPSLIISKHSVSLSDYSLQGSSSLMLGPIQLYGSAHKEEDPGNYSFVSPISGSHENRDHNAFLNQGYFGKMMLPLSKQNRLTFTQEFYTAKKEVPGSIAYPAQDLQRDHRWFSILAFHHSFLNKGVFALTLPYRTNELAYESSFGLSRHINHFIGPKIDIEFPIGQSHLLHTVGEANLNYLKSSYMDIAPRRKTFSVASSDEYLLSSNTTLTLSSRFEHAASLYTVGTPKIGLTHQLSKASLIKANTSYNFRAPSFDELYVHFPMFQGNPNLKSEKSLDGDIGMSFEDSGFKIEQSFFFSSLKDLISLKSVPSMPTTFENLDHAFIWGREFSIESITAIWKSLYASLDHTWLKTDLPYRSSHVLNGSVWWQYSAYKIFSEHQWTSRQKTSDLTRRELPSFLLVNLGTQWQIQKGASLDVRVENVFNTAYERIAYYPMPGRSFMVQFTGTL